ncbi:hypothetical protein [Flavobacterium sp.]|uniref:hypothetical protein n=1 Tax=Flavobacterium sp. TaxID=239 RepID=UPI0038FBEDAB
MENQIKMDNGIVITFCTDESTVENYNKNSPLPLLKIEYFSSDINITDIMIDTFFGSNEEEIIKKVKLIVDDIEFYKHFNIDFNFESSKNVTNDCLYSRSLKIQLKAESEAYIGNLTPDEKRSAHENRKVKRINT